MSPLLQTILIITGGVPTLIACVCLAIQLDRAIGRQLAKRAQRRAAVQRRLPQCAR